MLHNCRKSNTLVASPKAYLQSVFVFWLAKVEIADRRAGAATQRGLFILRVHETFQFSVPVRTIRLGTGESWNPRTRMLRQGDDAVEAFGIVAGVRVRPLAVARGRIGRRMHRLPRNQIR